jgi:hypothetical protein
VQVKPTMLSIARAIALQLLGEIHYPTTLDNVCYVNLQGDLTKLTGGLGCAGGPILLVVARLQ